MSSFLSCIPENPTSNSKCIIMLHGVWSNREDLFGLASYFSDEDYIFSLQGIFSLGNSRYAWYPVDFSTGSPIYKMEDVERGHEYIRNTIREISETYQLHPSQMFLMGFSQWAIMSYYHLYRSPKTIGGIIALSGRLLTEIDTNDINPDDYIHKRVFIGHGVEDSVIPVTSTGATSTFSRALGIEPTLKFYNAGRTITREEMTDIITFL